MKLVLLSPAKASASKVLPVPGGPTSSTPRGADAPNLAQCVGSCLKALTRFNPALASSLPMTSANCVCGRADSLDAAPPMPVCCFVTRNSAASRVRRRR